MRVILYNRYYYNTFHNKFFKILFYLFFMKNRHSGGTCIWFPKESLQTPIQPNHDIRHARILHCTSQPYKLVRPLPPQCVAPLKSGIPRKYPGRKVPWNFRFVYQSKHWYKPSFSYINTLLWHRIKTLLTHS